jgi:hypothetical protein
LVELVRVVVDARDEVARLVLVEEGDGQLLELGKERIAQVKKHAPPDAAHEPRLRVHGKKRERVNGQQERRVAEHAAVVFARVMYWSMVRPMMMGASRVRPS